MNSPIRRLSPTEYSYESGLPLGNAAYHFRALEKAGCIKIVDEQQRRGATEHYFEPVQRALTWTREYEDLPDIVKQHLDAVGLRGYVDAVGDAIDAGRYCKRAASHIAYDRFWTDQAGFAKASQVLDRALGELLEITAEARERLTQDLDATKFLAAYHLSLFETDLKPSVGT
ncbi:MAG: hypothetical protein JST31_03510 [Actinobacteria bacterium]|nr:hypothetical protein [Actinomycetota bacterium]